MNPTYFNTLHNNQSSGAKIITS